NGQWVVEADVKFVWDGWLLLMELDGNDNDAVLRTYTWGLDLSRDREGAGGIGGLLSVEDATIQGGPGEYVYFYDANGNVGQLVAWETGYEGATADEWHDDRLVARYEYDPYGNRTNEPAQGESEQPFQFSTHQFDAETGLLYAKNRYYSPRLGRWLNRDPLGEEASRGLYAAFQNNPVTRFDPDGRQDQTTGSPHGKNGCCGPEIRSHIEDALARVDPMFAAIPPPAPPQCNRELSDVCFAIHNTITGWDIDALADLGSKKDWRKSPLVGALAPGCGTGTCLGTVQYSGRCYRANEMNYILWGRLNKLCNERKSEWLKLAFNIYGVNMYQDCSSRLVPGFIHTWTWTAGVVSGYRAAFNAGLLQYIEAAPIGQGSTACRVSWARVGYSGGEVADECEVHGCGTKCCAEPYSGPPFNVWIGSWEQIPLTIAEIVPEVPLCR
ncbi:MAG: RHS repeat-associated core domain-containing protein, partial [Planctomycetes bacterium]|nr:RHS repeat-associated core domain-containing protein [Planctomycetota bacterium]